MSVIHPSVLAVGRWCGGGDERILMRIGFRTPKLPAQGLDAAPRSVTRSSTTTSSCLPRGCDRTRRWRWCLTWKVFSRRRGRTRLELRRATSSGSFGCNIWVATVTRPWCGSFDGSAGLALSTIRRRLSTLAGSMTHLVALGELDHNPVQRGMPVRSPVTRERRVIPLVRPVRHLPRVLDHDGRHHSDGAAQGSGSGDDRRDAAGRAAS